MITLRQRSQVFLNLSLFANAGQYVESIAYRRPRDCPDDQYVLRMLVMSPETKGVVLPPSLNWLREAINLCMVSQQLRVGVWHPYIYVTVRSGIVRSVNDDEWHVDGFSMKTEHAPEQNYVWTDVWPTEHLNQQFAIPDDFDPMRHNLHQFFQDRADAERVVALSCEHLHLIDPYIVHRRPVVPAGTQRTFFRISFVPIPIEDDSNTPNPLLPVPHFGSKDIRKTLTRYTETSHG